MDAISYNNVIYIGPKAEVSHRGDRCSSPSVPLCLLENQASLSREQGTRGSRPSLAEPCRRQRGPPRRRGIRRRAIRRRVIRRKAIRRRAIRRRAIRRVGQFGIGNWSKGGASRRPFLWPVYLHVLYSI